MKRDRKVRTTRAGVLGGVVGFVILGPIGAVGLGAGIAIATKRSLKRKEQNLRQKFENQGTIKNHVAVPLDLRRRYRKELVGMKRVCNN